MLNDSLFPILEFDSDKQAKINPSSIINKPPVPEACVITFFKEVINKKLEAGELEQIGTSYSETVNLPVYKTTYKGCSVGLVGGFVGAAGSAALLEELIASGFKKFIVCGGAGVLKKDIQVGHLVLPYSAVRDEGVSYHYIEPSREIECNPEAIMAIERILNREKIPYIKAKTWTTDAIFRETNAKIAKRVSEGCVTVEMEAAAFFAVAKCRNVLLGQILYGGDDLSGIEWDHRSWVSREKIRANLVDLCLKIATEL
ncbi:MAG: nucleoside phosphorylase [Clostridiaceae bacterium]|nr:nucleoside phosphorylase [Clostridiaceae bacterium]